MWQKPRYDFVAVLNQVMGNFCIKTADRRALVKELGRVYYELAVEKVRLRMAEDIAVDYSTDSDEAWRMHSDLAETTSKFAEMIMDLSDTKDKLEAELSREKALNCASWSGRDFTRSMSSSSS